MRMTTMHWEKNDIISVSQQLTVCGGGCGGVWPLEGVGE